MAMDRTQRTRIFDRLCKCNEAQLAYIEEHLSLPTAFLSRVAIAARAKEILDLLEQQPQKTGMDRISRLLDQVQSGAEPYLGERLAPLKDFLVESPSTANTGARLVGTIKDLREKLKDSERFEEPVLIKVRGTLFPAALLTAGWWERKRERALVIPWKNPLQRWLFDGFDLWAPSWDVCWGAVDPKQPSQPYYIAQLTEGDEADSLPVILGPDRAKRLADEFRDSWGGFEVTLVGMLGHRYQFEGRVPPMNLKRDPLDYYISIEDDNKQHTITRLTTTTDLYSGYLWKLLAPEEWVRGQEVLGLDQVYFVWEHTNFVEKEAVEYNLAGLEHKEGLIAARHPGSKLVLLQKSHEIVPGEPEWRVEKFYKLYLQEGKEL